MHLASMSKIPENSELWDPVSGGSASGFRVPSSDVSGSDCYEIFESSGFCAVVLTENGVVPCSFNKFLSRPTRMGTVSVSKVILCLRQFTFVLY